VNQSDANKFIEQRLTAEYAGGLKIIRQNAPVVREAESSSFIKLYIDPTISLNPFLGAIKSRRVGLILMELFAPIGGGNRVIITHAEAVGDIFNNQSFSGVVCYGSNIRDIGAATLEGEDTRRYKVAASIPYYYDKEAV